MGQHESEEGAQHRHGSRHVRNSRAQMGHSLEGPSALPRASPVPVSMYTWHPPCRTNTGGPCYTICRALYHMQGICATHHTVTLPPPASVTVHLANGSCQATGL